MSTGLPCTLLSSPKIFFSFSVKALAKGANLSASSLFSVCAANSWAQYMAK